MYHKVIIFKSQHCIQCNKEEWPCSTKYVISTGVLMWISLCIGGLSKYANSISKYKKVKYTIMASPLNKRINELLHLL